MATRFKINGSAVYDLDAIDQTSLKDVLLFNRQAAEFDLKWADIEQYSTEMASMSEADAANHPGAIATTAASIWIARRRSGEDISFGDAIDFPLTDLEFLPDTADRAPKAKGPKKSPKALPASGLAIADSPSSATA